MVVTVLERAKGFSKIQFADHIVCVHLQPFLEVDDRVRLVGMLSQLLDKQFGALAQVDF